MPVVYAALAATVLRFIPLHVDRGISPVYAEAVTGGFMAKLALIYGMRLVPEEDLGEVKDASIVLKNGRTARVTMHLIEGSKEEIESTFRQSIEAFFDMYPEI
jgi:hypothetical protein